MITTNPFILINKLLLISLISCSFILVYSCNSVDHKHDNYIFLDTWKFKAGDSIHYSKENYDDYGWNRINTSVTLKHSQYPIYDGYSWHRIVVDNLNNLEHLIVTKNDSLVIVMNNPRVFNELYFNGKPLNVKRLLLIDTSRIQFVISVQDPIIKWKDKNLIALRIYDESGKFSLENQRPYIKIRSTEDSIGLNKSIFYKPDLDKLADTNLYIRNQTNSLLSGTLSIFCNVKATGKTIGEKNVEITIKPGFLKKIPISLPVSMDPVCLTVFYRKNGAAAEAMIDEWSLPYVLSKNVEASIN